ncbi:hypothetical protein ACWDWO_24135 [Actinopolymorpha singaporensis]|uniref:Antibiotic biosynthesis monooxygenase n=1 Tax=Actinopolymorpha singaporensis TaxID=117157 RepID=A0A1H1TQQ4_9ACTN|nr:hypothetical protein [Actinopolymorpha singaporensis]SDS62603.1 hypothetical protein SAMN04489717_3302 [Actinopolymorpha singaporensis]
MADLFKWDQDLLSGEAYDELLTRLEAGGAGSPAGRFYHVCYGRPDHLKIVDVWDSPRHFQEFAEELMPVLVDLGGKPMEADVCPVYDISRPPWKGTATPGCLLARFEPPGMNGSQYEEIMKRLAEAGYGEPPERLYHVCYREERGLRMISVWQNGQAYRACFEQVVRICLDLRIPGVPLAEPAVQDVHHLIDGSPLVPSSRS